LAAYHEGCFNVFPENEFADIVILTEQACHSSMPVFHLSTGWFLIFLYGRNKEVAKGLLMTGRDMINRITHGTKNKIY
jgi:hypothetical protein